MYRTVLFCYGSTRKKIYTHKSVFCFSFRFFWFWFNVMDVAGLLLLLLSEKRSQKFQYSNENTKQRDWCIGVCLCVGVRERQNVKHWESLCEARMKRRRRRRRWKRRRRRRQQAMTTNGHQRPKGIKIQTKNAHTRYEIATTIMKHAQIHYTRCRYQMCIYGNDVCLFLGSISSEQAERKKTHTTHSVRLFFSVWLFVVYRRNIHTHNWTERSCCCCCCWFFLVVQRFFRWSGDFWWILLSVYSLFSFIHCIFFNSRGKFFSTRFCLSSQTKLVCSTRWKAEKNTETAMIFFVFLRLLLVSAYKNAQESNEFCGEFRCYFHNNLNFEPRITSFFDRIQFNWFSLGFCCFGHSLSVMNFCLRRCHSVCLSGVFFSQQIFLLISFCV